jgi:anti-sigma-K factor RskA
MARFRSHNTVGVYDRPPAWRTRKVLVPLAIVVIVALAYALYFLL